MPMFVIKRGHEYVAKPGGKRSFTKKLQEARVFPLWEMALHHKCSNEIISTVEEEMGIREDGGN